MMKVLAALLVIQGVSAATIVGNRLGCADDCDDIYSPVCATNDKTYSNLCECNMASCKADFTFEFSHYGVCDKGVDKSVRASACYIICPHVYDPVCGSDGKTYNSKCKMESKNCHDKTSVTIASTGACDSLLLSK